MNAPKSVAEHKAKGNYRPIRHANRVESISKIVETIPEPPKKFDKRHRQKWAEVCKNLFEMSLLVSADKDLIEKYVVNWFLAEDAWDEIMRDGITIDGKFGPTKHPAINIMNEAQKVVIQVGSLFAFNPRARMGIKVEDKKPTDPFERFIKNN